MKIEIVISSKLSRASKCVCESACIKARDVVVVACHINNLCYAVIKCARRGRLATSLSFRSAVSRSNAKFGYMCILCIILELNALMYINFFFKSREYEECLEGRVVSRMRFVKCSRVSVVIYI